MRLEAVSASCVEVVGDGFGFFDLDIAEEDELKQEVFVPFFPVSITPVGNAVDTEVYFPFFVVS